MKMAINFKKVISKRTPLAFQFLKFGIVGVLNTVIDFSLLNLLHLVFKIPFLLANTISVSSSIVNSFVWNKYWTFQNREKEFGRQFIKFVILSLVGLGINDGILYLSVNFLGSSAPLELNLSKIFASIFSMAWNFIAYKKWAFK